MSKSTRPIWCNVVLTVALVLVIFTAYKYVFIFHQNITQLKTMSIMTTTTHSNLENVLIKIFCPNTFDNKFIKYSHQATIFHKNEKNYARRLGFTT